jgi:hypothetical protein
MRECKEMEVRMMAEREACLADQQRMAEMFQYMQSLGVMHRFSLHHLHCSLQLTLLYSIIL